MPAMPNQTKRQRTAPLLACFADPYCATPCQSEPSLPCPSSPRQARPRPACQTLPNLADTKRSMPAAPHRAIPFRTQPRHACLTLPDSANPDPDLPNLPAPAMPKQTVPDPASRNHAPPSLLWFKRCQTWLLLLLLCHLAQLETIQIHILRLLCYQDDQRLSQPVNRNGSPS